LLLKIYEQENVEKKSNQSRWHESETRVSAAGHLSRRRALHCVAAIRLHSFNNRPINLSRPQTQINTLEGALMKTSTLMDPPLSSFSGGTACPSVMPGLDRGASKQATKQRIT
jgi:hypothetical protein